MYILPNKSTKTEPLIKQTLKKATGLSCLQSMYSFLGTGDAQKCDGEHLRLATGVMFSMQFICTLQLLRNTYFAISIHFCTTPINQNPM